MLSVRTALFGASLLPAVSVAQVLAQTAAITENQPAQNTASETVQTVQTGAALNDDLASEPTSELANDGLANDLTGDLTDEPSDDKSSPIFQGSDDDLADVADVANSAETNPDVASFDTDDFTHNLAVQNSALQNEISAPNSLADDLTETQQSSEPAAEAASSQINNAERSLQKLSEYYQAKGNMDARCHGVWVLPNQKHGLLADNNAQPAGAYYAQADYGYWNDDDYAELTGNVILEQDGRQVMAQKVIFNPKTGEATASGQVLFSDANADGTSIGAGMFGVAQTVEYQADGKTAGASDVAFASTTMGAHGHAQQMTKIDDAHYQLQGVMFSTCPPTERKWHLDAQSIDINSDTGRGIAKNSTLKIGDVPVFYLPYFNFPIDERRASGFLLPSAGFGSSDGFKVSAPYYLNLAPNYDATLTPTAFTNRNPMLSAEFRYLTEQFGAGKIDAAYLPSDRKYHGEDRSHLFYDHYWQSKAIDNLSAYANYRYVSDNRYLSDFDTLGLDNNPLNLPRRIGLGYYNDYLTADLRAETFQTLDGTNSDGSSILDKDKPYSRLPQLAVSYVLPKFYADDNEKLAGLEISGVHNSGYFKKSIKDGSETEKSGARMYNQISASYPLLKSWGYFTPKLSLAQLYASYDEDSLADQNLSKEDGSYSVFAPQVSLDAGVFFEKSGSPFGWFDGKWGGHQVVSPRLKYNYTPYKDQSNIPNFETSIASLSYDQLLSDSWFLGYDRIADLHAITPAINYRYIDKNGITRFDGGVAEQIYLDDVRVGIDNDRNFTGSSSGLAWQMSAQPYDRLWVDAAGAFTKDYDINNVVAQVRFSPTENSLFNFGVVERKENRNFGQRALSAYTASAIFPINNRWRVLSQAQYDYKNSRFMETLLGLNYEDCCYGLSVYARRYRNDLNPDAGADTAVMAEIRLNGITSGGRLSRLLSDKVQGFDNVQHAWQQAY
ncbi:LPS biosynthesis protein [Moraxella caviae]|uniref:LPS-assembly protein LptD n=2 Tax=Moraxella caviae TaxID=34060 RepID=A0A1T0A5U5_9GAMM|nr:LPS biosynthesis protein [Moraxella caviae]STZ14197.1 Organic solvent tolerance protein [Moraxella caviae]VEW13426.1 Organic solvent tolerance protein [Moraxella caviae]VEW13565.1 Organic solvent tolerance protein [Moraxella caviae]